MLKKNSPLKLECHAYKNQLFGVDENSIVYWHCVHLKSFRFSPSFSYDTNKIGHDTYASLGFGHTVRVSAKTVVNETITKDKTVAWHFILLRYLFPSANRLLDHHFIWQNFIPIFILCISVEGRLQYYTMILTYISTFFLETIFR